MEFYLGAMPIVAHLLGADKRDNIGKVIRHTIFFGDSFFGSYHFNWVFYFLDTLLTHLHLEPQVHYIAKMYMAAVAVGVIPFFMSTSLRALIDTFRTYRYHNEDLFAGAAGKCLF